MGTIKLHFHQRTITLHLHPTKNKLHTAVIEKVLTRFTPFLARIYDNTSQLSFITLTSVYHKWYAAVFLKMIKKLSQFGHNVQKGILFQWVLIPLWDKWPKCLSEKKPALWCLSLLTCVMGHATASALNAALVASGTHAHEPFFCTHPSMPSRKLQVLFWYLWYDPTGNQT